MRRENLVKITNNKNLPITIVRAMENDYSHTKDKYSITTLEKGVREILLARRHEDELEMDASEGIWALLGQLMHKLLEEVKEGDDQFKEEYITMEFPFYKNKGFLGYKEVPEKTDIVEKLLFISGKFDLYDYVNKEVMDYKLTSTWSYVFGAKEEWEKQLAGYGIILKHHGFPVDKAQNIILYRDWSKGKSFRGGNYPKESFQLIRYNLTEESFASAYNFIVEKLSELVKHENTPDDELPFCNERQRWAKATKYAVMKKNRVSAVRLLNSRQEAEDYMIQKSGDFIVERLGESTKCLHYCSVCKFCNFWKDNVKEELEALINSNGGAEDDD